MKIGINHIGTLEELLTETGVPILTEHGESIYVGGSYDEITRVNIKKACEGYYLRWYYNGWHYWFFLPGKVNYETKGEPYNTRGTRKLSMGSGQVTYGQCNAIRTIMNSREIQLLTVNGWMNVFLERSGVTVYENQINGYEIDIVAIIGSREGALSPVAVVPDTVVNQFAIVITHHNHGIFTMTISGIAGTTITIDWGDGTPPEVIVLTGGDDVITHDYTGTTGDHDITIEGDENIITITADGQEITDITIPPTAVNLTELNLPNNEITDSPDIPVTVPLVEMDLQGNPLTICEVVIGTQIWMCYNLDTDYPGSKLYEDDPDNKILYGRLYNFTQINNAGFLPSGWHIPTKAEWEALIIFAGGNTLAGGRLKSLGLTYWDAPSAGTDVYDFDARGGGLHGELIPGEAPEYFGVKEFGKFWTNDNDPTYYWNPLHLHDTHAFHIEMTKDSAATEIKSILKSSFLSVRLIKNFSISYTPISYSDWFLPSMNESLEMYNILKVFGFGGFSVASYWTSTEVDNDQSVAINFADGTIQQPVKSSASRYVRACRKFTSVTVYALRDVGPAGGRIFWRSGNNYLEAAPTDQSIGKAWSNIINLLIGTTGVAIGTGQANTTAIIGQAGHIDSAAKLCNDLIIVH
jgi:uncharacterized protein (TIGR02145 family)